MWVSVRHRQLSRESHQVIPREMELLESSEHTQPQHGPPTQVIEGEVQKVEVIEVVANIVRYVDDGIEGELQRL